MFTSKSLMGGFAKIVDVAKDDAFFKFRDKLIGALIRVNYLVPISRDGPYSLVSGTVVLKDIPLNGTNLEIGGQICLKAVFCKVNLKQLFSLF